MSFRHDPNEPLDALDWVGLLISSDDPILLLRELEPVLDELCAWVDTDLIGCVEVQERGEDALRKVREFLSDPEVIALIEGRG